MTLAQFNNLPPFRQRQFCKDYPADIAIVAGDARAGELDTQADALKGAENSKKNTTTKPKAAAAPAKDTVWTKKERQDACAKLPPEGIGQINPTPPGTTPTSGVGAKIVNGVDKETEAKKKSEWLTAPLIQDAVKGGFVGLLIGSLFGPIGLIAGPIIGAALFYGVTKVMSKEE